MSAIFETYNRSHNILELLDILTSEMERDFY